jgi:crotonobetainyl-CoA:carnitine CoA-transferase CaiB-like acyl-CoA transferase
VQAREMMLKVVNFMGSGADLHVAGNPVKLSENPCDIKLNFPKAGEDTESVLRDAGYSGEEIKSLRDSGAV